MVKHRSSEALAPQISAIEVFVTRPVVAISFCLLIMLAGIKSSLEMTVSEFPQIESAALRIHTTFVGASADEVKSFITIPIEEAVSNVSGIDYVDSVTKAGSSIVTVWLNLNEHVPDALAEISTSINRIKYKIPSGAYDPQIEIIRADRPWASFYLPVILSDGMSRTLVTDYLERNVVPVFSAIPNVRKSEVIGGRAPAIRVWLKPELLESNNVSASDIRRALLENNIVATFGKTQNSDKRVDLFVNSLLTDLNEFESLVVRQDVGDLVRLRDVAEVELDEEEGEGEEDSRLDDADDADEEEEDEGAGGGRLLDPMTGVLRDKLLSTYMHRRLNEFRLKKHPVALFCVGVDNMDQIQRFHGEAAHDALLAEVSQQLQLNLRSGDMIGRHEERGFLVLVGCGVEYMEAVAQRVCGAVQQAICRFEGKRLRTTVTVGISHYPAHGKNLHQLYVKGDKVVSYCRENDIRGYAVYAEQLHGRQKVLPAASIKATRR